MTTLADLGPACLLIHGYGGSPFEMEGPAAALAEAGFAVRVPCLPGHGEGYKDFGKYRFADWLAHAEEELKDMLARHERVVLVGFSMGGALALNLACRYPVVGVAVLSTPVYVLNFWPWPLDDLKFYGRTALTQARRFLGLSSPKVSETGESSRVIAPWKGYAGPLHFRQLGGMRIGCANTRALLPSLTVPLLIIQDEHDKLVNPENAWVIARCASSPDTTVVLTRIRETVTSHHTITTHRETAAMVAERLVRFCREKMLDPRPAL